jgi:hypothetical protein
VCTSVSLFFLFCTIFQKLFLDNHLILIFSKIYFNFRIFKNFIFLCLFSSGHKILRNITISPFLMIIILLFMDDSFIQRVPKKKRRVHSSLIYRRILIIYTPNQMVVSRLQNGLINSRIAPRASRLNCQNIFFSNGITYFFFSNSD